MSKQRYEDVPEMVIELLTEVKKEHFPELRNARIKVLFDIKKRTRRRVLALAGIMRPNELLRHFTKDESENYDGYDYIIILDKVCWEAIENIDRIRILRHELRHTYFNIDTEENPYCTIDHEITDFYKEVELNSDDPTWRHRISRLTVDIYDQRKEEGKTGRKKRE